MINELAEALHLKHREPDPFCIKLESGDLLQLKLCEHCGMWRLITPYTDTAGVMREGTCEGFSGAFAWSVREAARHEDADLLDALNYLFKNVEQFDLEDDHHTTLLDPTIELPI